jgi:hypothetical protein
MHIVGEGACLAHGYRALIRTLSCGCLGKGHFVSPATVCMGRQWRSRRAITILGFYHGSKSHCVCGFAL